MDIKLETLRYHLVIFWRDFFTIDFLLEKWAICNTKPLHDLCEKKIKNTYLQKMHFSPKNWEPTEKNMTSNESRDPEETMREI